MALNDRIGTALHTFCALVPLADRAAACAALAQWPAESPFARLPHTHFARLVVLPELRRDVGGQPSDLLAGPYLMFSAFFDVEPDRYLAALCAELGDEAHAVFRHCRGCPGHPGEIPARFCAWLEEHRVPATAIFGAYADATVAEVREALAFREAFRAFAFEREAARDGKAAFAAFAEGRR